MARNGATLIIRPLTPAHVAALQRFNAALSDHTRSLFLPHAYDEATLARYVARQAQGQDRNYVLCDGLEVAGHFFLWEMDQPVPLLGLGLADAWHGQGMGGKMLQHLIADARKARREGVELTTVPANERALRLYQRAGFVLVGEVDNVGGDGRLVRELRMFLPLRPGARPPHREFKPPV